jgi:hypothetical protein
MTQSFWSNFLYLISVGIRLYKILVIYLSNTGNQIKEDAYAKSINMLPFNYIFLLETDYWRMKNLNRIISDVATRFPDICVNFIVYIEAINLL